MLMFRAELPLTLITLTSNLIIIIGVQSLSLEINLPSLVMINLVMLLFPIHSDYNYKAVQIIYLSQKILFIGGLKIHCQ